MSGDTGSPDTELWALAQKYANRPVIAAIARLCKSDPVVKASEGRSRLVDLSRDVAITLGACQGHTPMEALTDVVCVVVACTRQETRVARVVFCNGQVVTMHPGAVELIPAHSFSSVPIPVVSPEDVARLVECIGNSIFVCGNACDVTYVRDGDIKTVTIPLVADLVQVLTPCEVDMDTVDDVVLAAIECGGLKAGVGATGART